MGNKYFKSKHCPRGHEFTEQTLYVDPKGVRRCRLCKAQGDANRKIKNYDDIQAYQRDWNLKTKGWTAEKFDQAYKDQDEKCFLCEKHIIARIFGSNMACADHVHTTPPRPRALLCMHCNTALGQLQDNPALLRKAAEYIENFR